MSPSPRMKCCVLSRKCMGIKLPALMVSQEPSTSDVGTSSRQIAWELSMPSTTYNKPLPLKLSKCRPTPQENRSRDCGKLSTHQSSTWDRENNLQDSCTALAPYMAALISPAQSAFIKKRSIHDNFMYVRNLA